MYIVRRQWNTVKVPHDSYYKFWTTGTIDIPKELCYPRTRTMWYQYQNPAERDTERYYTGRDMFTVLNKVKCDNTYSTFQIPKQSGGFRTIEEPNPNLKTHQRNILAALNYTVPYVHDSAFAYVNRRSYINALQVHQEHQSKYFLKIDLKDFFPSCNKEFIIKMLEIIYPFATYTDEWPWLDYCLINNRLPQGAPTSPKISNIIMIPFDVQVSKYVYDKNCTYTRYADDILISSREPFRFMQIVNGIERIIKDKDYPFKIKNTKTRYGSCCGANWNLGLMYNKDKEITVGHKRKHYMKISLHNYTKDKENGIRWTLEDLQHLLGEFMYIERIEPNWLNSRYPGTRQTIINEIKSYNITI